MKRTFIPSSVIAVFLFLGATIGSAQIAGTIDKVWVESGVKVKGETGLRIHAKFSLTNALNAECAILATVQRADGGSFAFDRQSDPGAGFRGTTKAGASYNTYATKDGKSILMLKPFTSPYERSSYADTTIFFPYWALLLRGGNPNKMKVFVTISNGGKEFVRSAVVEFSLPAG